MGTQTAAKQAGSIESFGHYRIVRPLSKGGAARLYEAFDEFLGRKVALKIISREFLSDPKNVRRFRQEAQSLSRVRHPNIVTIYSAGVEGDHHFIAMEFIEGKTLSARMKEGPVPMDKALTWFEGMLGAVGAVHAMGILHRDVRPANVIITPDDTAKLTDFGLAKPAADEPSEVTGTVTIGVAVDYLAPEILRGQPATAQTDVYALGVILHELLSGRPAFAGENSLLKAQAIRTKGMPPLRSLNPDVPPALEALVVKMTCREPAERYATIADVQRDFAR